MRKADAINRWGAEIVEEARDYYETDFDKALFEEDITSGNLDWIYPATVRDVYERCSRAYFNIKGHVLHLDLLENIRNEDGKFIRKYDFGEG